MELQEKMEEKKNEKREWRTPITIEPSYALFWFLENCSTFLFNNLFLQKECRYNQTSEPDLTTPCDSEKDGVTFVAFVNSWIKMTDITCGVILTIFVSSWSDKAGKRRRPFIFLPLIGLSLEIFLGCLNSYLWKLSALSAALEQSFVHIVTGGRALLFLIGNVYISDITTMNNRTRRIGILVILRFLMVPVSNAVTGYMLRGLGFFNSFLICFFVSIIALILALKLTKDVSEPITEEVRIWSLFNFSSVIESVKIIFKKRPQNRRLVLILLLITNFLSAFSKEGEYSILYLYMRYRFHWNESQYGIYAAYQNVGIIFGLIFCLYFLSTYLKIHDGIIGAMAGFWDTIAAFCYIFATEPWELYTIPMIDLFHGTAYIVVKAFLTKIVDDNEQGHLSCVIALSLLLAPINHTVYNVVFKNYMDTFPSSFFLVSVAVDIPVCVLYWLSYRICMKNKIET